MPMLTTSLLSAVVLAHNPSLSVPTSPSELASLERVPSRVGASTNAASTHFHGYFVNVRDLRGRANAGSSHRAGVDLSGSAEHDTSVDAIDLDSQAGQHTVASGGAVVATPVGAQLRSGLNFEAPEGGPPTSSKGHWWSVHIAPGASMIFIGNYGAGAGVFAGPSLRLGGHVHKFFDKFYIGGGPQLHYSGYFDKFKDSVHLMTFGGDLFLGGGNEKIVGYGHIELGVGFVNFKDGQSNLSGTGLAGRLAVGGGLHGYITRKFSMGFLADFVVPYGLDLFLTMGIHFR